MRKNTEKTRTLDYFLLSFLFAFLLIFLVIAIGANAESKDNKRPTPREVLSALQACPPLWKSLEINAEDLTKTQLHDALKACSDLQHRPVENIKK